MAAVDISVNSEGWPLSPEGYEILMEVGQGAFAKVVKARCPSKGTLVAIKIMSLENITTSLEEIQAEVKTMKLSRNENVVDLYCCFVVGDELWLVMPLMDRGSCYYALRSLRKKGKISDGVGLPEDCIAIIIRELLQGLDYIHEHGQIHRDIKAGNILLNSEGRVAIADFGVAGWTSETGEKIAAVGGEGPRKTFVGTPCWMAPEVMEPARGYNQKADIWSVGITTLELFKGYAPYAKLAPMQVLIRTIREAPPSLSSYADGPSAAPPASSRFVKFVARCLQKDPRLRPSAHELLTDPFIKKAPPMHSKVFESLLLDIPEVGSEGSEPAAHKPVKTVFEPTFVPGTTWVFPEFGDEKKFEPMATLDEKYDELEAMEQDVNNINIRGSPSAT